MITSTGVTTFAGRDGSGSETWPDLVADLRNERSSCAGGQSSVEDQVEPREFGEPGSFGTPIVGGTITGDDARVDETGG